MSEKRKVGQVLSDNKLAQRYQGSNIGTSILVPKENKLWLPSKILALNYQLGGGILYGSIMELFGPESSGKTLLACNFGSVAQALGGVVLWGDAEGTFDMNWAIQHGIDPEKFYWYPNENAVEVLSDWQADMIVTMRSKLTHNEPILLVIDSLASLECMENIESSQVDSRAEMGTRAKAIYTMLRRRNSFYVKYGVCVIYINQLRQKVGASKYEDPDITPGGNAMKFYASQRIGLYTGKQIKNEDDEKVGQYVHIRTKKNKVSPPKGKTIGEVYFTEYNGKFGYEKDAGFIDVLISSGVIKAKRGKIYTYKGERIAHGDTQMMKALNDPKLRKKFIKKAGIITVSEMRRRLSEQTRNLYPIKIKLKKSEDEG